MPLGIEDRDADVWEALLVIADAAGGEWPERARKAAMALVAEAKATTPSLGIRLLADLRIVFGDRRAMSTEEIIKALCAIEEAPWSDLRGKALNDIGLANRLRPYGIKSDRVDLDNGQRLRGYLRPGWQTHGNGTCLSPAIPSYLSNLTMPQQTGRLGRIGRIYQRRTYEHEKIRLCS